MTIRQLQYFAKIYECGNLLKAAELLYISQQALSRSLSTLEKEIGMPLFYRNARGVTPTASGTELYQACGTVLREMDALESRVQELRQLNSGTLRVGLAAGARYLNVRSLWRNFQELYPHVVIQVQEYPYVTSLEMLRNKELDVVTFSDYTAEEGYVQSPIKTWERCIIVPEEHALSKKRSISPTDLKGEHLVTYTSSFMLEQFFQHCQQFGCLPAEVISVGDALYMYETCQRERILGITIQGYFTDVFSPQFPSLRAIPLADGLFSYTISVLSRQGHPMGVVIQELTNFLQSFLERG